MEQKVQTELAREYAEELEYFYNEERLDEYLECIMDVSCIVDTSGDIQDVILMRAWGGPNIYINTRRQVVEVYWGNYGEWDISHDIKEALVNFCKDLYSFTA